MTIEELKARKRQLGYTNKMIAELSGVPFGTVQKIFSGSTRVPRFDTLMAIERVLGIAMFPSGRSVIEYDFTNFNLPTSKVSEELLAERYGTKKKPGEYTSQDLEQLPEGCRVELIGGRFYDMAPPTRAHQIVVQEVAFQLTACVKNHGSECQLYIAPTGVKLAWDNRTVVEPDIAVSCGKKKLSDIRYLMGPPDLCVEVLSPSNRDYDMYKKMFLYKECGVKEYWIIDPDSEQVIIYLFEKAELAKVYSFNDQVPVGISEGECSVDFTEVKRELDRVKGLCGQEQL